MKKVNNYNRLSATYLVAGILFIMVSDQNMVYGILAVVSLVGAWVYSESADEAKEKLRQDEVMKHLDEDGCGND